MITSAGYLPATLVPGEDRIDQRNHLPIRTLLAKYGITPRKKLGQNFLTSRAALDRIVAAADLSRQDLVLEIGPGLGALTQRLAGTCGGVIALELDGRFISPLREILALYPNVRILQGDILRVDIADLLKLSGFASPPLIYKVVSNLPYYATSAILRRLLEAERKACLLVVTVQREVAVRMVAAPGRMSLLAVSVQFYGSPKIVARIPRGAFYPAPEVDSAVVRVDVRSSPLLPVGQEAAFFQVVRAGFAQSRKQLRNSLASGLGLPPLKVAEQLACLGLDPHRRAQELNLAEWVSIYRVLAPALPRKLKTEP